MIVCGIDEAGRGCLAGPLVVAGVVLHKDIAGVTDSKKLTSKKREILYDEIYKNATVYKVVTSANEIDFNGLSKSIHNSLSKIKNSIRADRYIFDGNSSFGVSDLMTIVKADLTVKEVSAASIVAKVTKDRLLLDLAKDYPQFGFEKHQGYATKFHYEALEKYGATPFHRKSFRLFKQNSLF